MYKTASVSETRQQLSVFLNWIKDSQEDVVIQNRGAAEAVLIPIADYELLQEARERQRRQHAIAELRKIAQDIGARNPQLSQAEADDIANEVMAETIDNLRQQGKVNFQD
ncbi:MAG: type II toxin-antitoxin system Phd/YefM family antitoxin [Anaerolineae bacterium]|nr:type II toxin-antitoxin system Phd/YefM family antitoxin [Anaerolineae bacterium]